MKIVGIDPGTTRIGYACIAGSRHRVRVITVETIAMASARSSPERLLALERVLGRRLRRDRPELLAVEKIFFSKNSKTALAVAETRGVILLTGRRYVHSIGEYTPLEVKLAVTGYGRADKKHMRRMIRSLLPGTPLPSSDDAVDALAIALTALYRSGDVSREP